jgi:hypothetical protein
MQTIMLCDEKGDGCVSVDGDAKVGITCCWSPEYQW